MAQQALSKHFAHFFRTLNPSPTFVKQASSEHKTIASLIEDPNGLASALSPHCFLQGSYKQQTSIYAINDIDIVTLCRLWHPGPEGGKSWCRDDIFATIAAPLLADHRYKSKVRYSAHSVCIKLDLGIRVEILPVVYQKGVSDPSAEPFRLYRPTRKQWEDGYARYHQAHLTDKNSIGRTGGNFIPLIKVVKHLRSQYNLDAVSFHIECLLHALSDNLFVGGPADYIAAVLAAIAATPPETWYKTQVTTPCGERHLFSADEWSWASWQQFHAAVVVWAKAAVTANQAIDRAAAVELWQVLLGDGFFPANVS